MERYKLHEVTEKTEAESKDVIFQIARDYAQLVGLDFENKILPDLKNNIFWDVDYLSTGEWGLSLMDAYRCLVDVHRTTQIMGGIKETIKSLKSQGKNEIYAIDAGTGTGIFSIYLASLGVDKIFALELNSQTADYAKKFINLYNLQDKIKVIESDATAVNIPELKDRPADILISENLSGGLFAEPQFQIINHLSKFLTPDAPIIPFAADLSVSLGFGDWDKVDWGNKKPRNVVAERRVPNLTQTSDKKHYSSVISKSGMEVPRIQANITIDSPNTVSNTLLISTVFQINKEGKIYKLESDSAEFLGKTIAIKLPTEVSQSQGTINLNFDYQAGFSVRNNPEAIQVSGNKITLKDK